MGELTVIYENKIREDFRRKQEAEEPKLREDKKRRQILLDEVLAKELQDEEESKHKRQMGCVMEETDTQERLRQVEKKKQFAGELEKMQKQLSEDLKQQMECNYKSKHTGYQNHHREI